MILVNHKATGFSIADYCSGFSPGDLHQFFGRYDLMPGSIFI
jgi:hypothetical protein